MTPTMACKVCNSKATFEFESGWKGQPQTFPYYCCSNPNCGLLQTDYLDSLTEAQISEIYASDSYWNDNSGKPRSHLPLDKVNLAQVLVPSAHKILDIGSGEGWGVSKLREAGLEAYGYDVVQPKMCAEYITVGKRESVVEQYDVVTAIEVVEHLGDPVAACHWISSLVRPGGAFVFSTSTFDAKKHTSSWWYLKHVGHICLHTPSSLALLAKATGFRVVADIFSTHVWLRSETVPPGAAARIKLKHVWKKLLDQRSYRIMQARMQNLKH